MADTTITEDVYDDAYEEKPGPSPPLQIVWRNVLLMSLLHLGAFYGLTVLPSVSSLTLIWTGVCFMISALGITAGAHRLWSHRSYKASLPLRAFLAVANSMAFQNDIYEWARDHRVHHKFSETDADPHNARRGFFFAHIGWLLVRKHPEVIEKGRKLELADLKADGVALQVICGGDVLSHPHVCTLVLLGRESLDQLLSSLSAEIHCGEGFHNYHHTFPHDYATSEFGSRLNVTKAFIDLMCFFGLANDCRRVTRETIMARVKRTGDGSHKSG
ncbi:Acyl-CoA desaturase [Labeo rohita]|uniref:stearoyl-CoA 9-desaturase n=1 Tax=Labeo rohita TaxID=84645 RepID=A0ABQ8M4R7_LABRO|nr:Acyl-CoA desaturase [Labeo rohita]